MINARIIPVILLSDKGMVKTVKYKNPTYIGDPINAVRIYNEKEVDEIIILDINASASGLGPNYARLEEIASEAFMPLGYGGGIKNIDQMERLYKIGIEKIIINTALNHNFELLKQAADIFGSQSVVVSINVKQDLFGRYKVVSNLGKSFTNYDLITYVTSIQNAGAGEIIISSVDKDGTMTGYDIDLLTKVSKHVHVPLVFLGGAGSLEHLKIALKAGASSVAAGSMFVYHGRHKAVLISYITPDLLN